MISKKMGRPSRKQIASTVMYKEPNGDTYYFTIDKKGNSTLLEEHLLSCPQSHLDTNLNPIHNCSHIKSAEYSQKSIFTDDNDKNIVKKKKSPEAYIEMDQFDEFLSCLNYQINVDSFFKDHKLSQNMFPNHY